MGDSGEAIFCFDGETVRLAHRIDGHDRELDAIDLEGQSKAGFWRKARSRFARLDLSRAPLTLQIPPGKTLRKTIELPLAAEENLHEVVGFEMDRRTPFRADEVYYDQRILERDTKTGKLNVDLLVAPRGIVDGALARATEWRLRPHRVEAQGSGTPDSDPLDLMPPNFRKSGTRSRIMFRILMAVALILLTSAIAIPFQQNKTIAERLTTEVSLARLRAAEVEAMRAELDALMTGGRTIVDQRLAEPRAIAVIAELTRILPDDTWAFQVRIEGGEVQVHGYSAVAAKLIEKFEQSELLEDVRFRSPVTRDNRVGLERFHLSARISQGDAS